MGRPQVALLALAAVTGCAELRGRKLIQEGNAAYNNGDFAGAAQRFEQAATHVPEMPLLWLNRGYACREMIVPGANAAVNQAAASCALQSFKKLRELSPEDPRGDRLYVQTLLDLGEYKTLERTFTVRHERAPADLDIILVMQQVYSKTGRWRDALVFYRKAAALQPRDAEAHYLLGTFIWQVLQARGGGTTFATYDPRPRPDSPTAARPTGGPDDITGAERVALAEEGIRSLGRAVGLRPHYPDAFTYMGLLYRQQSFALFDDPPAWERVVAQAVAHAERAMEKR